MGNHTNSQWTAGGQALIDRLKELHESGTPCSTTAALLNQEFGLRLTRNSIIGKAHRLRIQSPNPPGFERQNTERRETIAKRGPRVRIRRQPPRPVVSPTQAAAELAAVEPRHLSLLELSAGQCRFPYGEGPFTFCGCEATAGSPYCGPHRMHCEGQPREAPQARVIRSRKHLAVLRAEAVAA